MLCANSKIQETMIPTAPSSQNCSYFSRAKDYQLKIKSILSPNWRNQDPNIDRQAKRRSTLDDSTEPDKIRY